jgi:hypothetical protein
LWYGHYYFIDNEAFLDGMKSLRSPRISPQLPLTFNLTPEWIFLPRHALSKERTMSSGCA